VPTIASSKNQLPVLVWIYGGAYAIGFSGRYLYGPKYLVRHEVILVTVNYRLGPYGFMCLDTPEVPGNQGLKDQLLALKWIKNNIKAFGGDPNKITIFGQSAGGSSVDFLLMYTEDKLFDRVILQSGTSLLPLNSYNHHKDAPQLIAARLGFVTSDMNDAISFLASVDPSLVIAASSELGLHYRPCVEQQYEGVEGLILESWVTKTQIPKIKRMPILIGYTDDEFLVNYLNKPQSFFENLDVFNDLLSGRFNTEDSDFAELKEIVRHFYIGDGDISESKKFELGNFESDFIFIHPTYRTISRYLANNAGNVYHYVFSYTGSRNLVKRRHNVTEGGAVHSDEIGYLFDISFFDETPTHEDQLVIDRITTIWTNFAKFG
jgi:carboxylesterase type B